MKAKANASLDRISTARSPHSTLLWILGMLWVVLLCVGLFFWRLGSVGLVDETEPLFAEAARQMSLTGDWITPYFNGQTRFDKPPLIYWLMAIAYQLIGVNAWAVRLPSALAATGLTGFGFYTLRYFGFPRPARRATIGVAGAQAEDDRRSPTSSPTSSPTLSSSSSPVSPTTNRLLWLSAWAGATLMALNLQTLVWARTGVSDMLLSACIGSSLFAFFLGYAQPERPKVQARWYTAFYILCALAVLAKGPVGVIVPGLIIVAFLLYVGQFWKVLREIKLGRGTLLFLLLTVPWYVLVIQANGQAYIDNFFGYHNFQRFTQVVNRHWGPWYFYFVVVPLSFFPWSAYLPISIARLKFWHVQHWRQQPRSHQLGIFALIWFATIFGFFSISSTKLPSYTLPLLPAAAVLSGLFWSEQIGLKPRSSWAVKASHIAHMILCLALAIGLWFVPPLVAQEPELPGLATFLRQASVLPTAIVVWTSVAIASLILLLWQRAQWLWGVAIAGFLAFLTLTLIPTFTYVDGQRQLPVRQVAATLDQVKQPNEPIAMLGPGKPSIVFYSHQRVTFIARPSEVPRQLRRIARRNRRQPSILVVGRDRKLVEAGITPDRYQVIQITGQYKLVRMNVAAIPPDRQPGKP